MKRNVQIFVIFLAGIFPDHSNAETFIAYCRNYPPELFFEKHQCVGVLPEMMSDIFNELGHDLKWVNAPWIRSYREAKEGNADLLIRHSMTEERKAILLPITYGYVTRHLSFYKSDKFAPDIKSYADLEKLNIGAIRGVFYSPDFSNLEIKTLTLVGKTEQLLALLERGRIDVAVTSEAHNIELFEDRFEKVTFVDTFINPLFISIPKNSKAVRIYKDVAEKMLEYRKSGKVNLYFERYGIQAPKQIFE